MPTKSRGSRPAAKKTAAKKTTTSKSASTSAPKGADAIENDETGTGPSEDNDSTADARAAAAAHLPGPGLPPGVEPEKVEADVKVQIVEPTDEPEAKVESELVEKGFVYQHNLDPARQIPGTSKYLDFELRLDAERDRARVEGREPDLENPPSMQGTPFRSADQINSELPYSANVDPDVVLEVSQVKTSDEDKKANDEKSEGNTSNLLNKHVGVNE